MVRLELAFVGSYLAGGVSADGLVIGPWSLVYKAHDESEELWFH